jgi:hypothetical protein
MTGRQEPAAGEEPGMNPEDAARWATALTLTDLGELTALFLEGKISQTPSHCAPPDPETTPLLAMLASVNRAGFMTHQSQPGIPRDEHGSAQRANVSGFASDEAFARLVAAVATADLIITAGRAGQEFGPFFPITLDYGEEFTWDGLAINAEEISYHYGPYCRPEAVAELQRAWQVTIIDPEWGRNDVLWPVLTAFAKQPA